jgi:hypothetical protein
MYPKLVPASLVIAIPSMFCQVNPALGSVLSGGVGAREVSRMIPAAKY